MKQLYLCLVAALLSFSSFAAPTPTTGPSAIAGTLAICDGGTGSLSSSPTGGTWSSDNVVVVAIDPATGVIAGVTSGTSVVSYTDGSGFVTAIVTVNPTPPAIMGTPVVCVGSSVLLTDLATGGSWSSTNLAVASVDGAGTVTGYLAGTATISYTLTTGCAASTEVTVNAVPPAISGVTTVCTGGTTTLANSVSGGVWTSDNVTIADVNFATGEVTGISAGIANITYTLMTGCIAVTPVTVSSTVTPIMGFAGVCPGGTATLTNATPGGTWFSSDVTVGTIDLSGVFTGYSPGTTTISYTVSGGCSSTLVGTVYPTPNVYSVTGGGSFCIGGAGVNIGLGGSQPGVSYQLFLGASAVGSPIAGTGGALSFGMITMPGTYTVEAVSSATTCTASMTGSATVSAVSSPDAIAGTLFVCVGSATTLSNTLLGGSWSTSASTVSVGASDGSVVGLTPGTATITYSAGTCGDVYADVTVNALPAAITGTAHICAGSTASLSNTTAGGAWLSDNTFVATVDATTGVVTGASAGTATISYLLATGCASTTIATVNVAPTISGAATSVCSGGTATLSASGGIGAWSSSAPTIATVTPTGLVSGMSAGSVTITLVNACGIATRNLIIAGSSTFDLSVTETINYNTFWSNGYIYVSNTQCGSVSPVLTMNLSPKFTMLYSWPAATSVSGNVITWNLAPVSTSGTSMQSVWVSLLPSGFISAGDTVHTDFQVGPVSGDMNTTNNFLASVHTVTGSYDPNQKMVSPEGFILPCQELTYTVQFENDGNDTAHNIYVLDTLSANLDPTSIVAVSSTHPMSMTVYTSGAYNIAKFDFTGINLPDSSHHGEANGEFIFKIKAATGLTDGTTISNRVGIYFDANPPVMTNYVTNTIGIAPMVGPGSVCRGSSITLTNATAGGTWASTNGRTIVTNGVVSGIGGGLDTVTYTTSNTCTSRTASATVLVNTVPTVGPITGATGMCVGATTTMGNSISGGMWTSSNVFTGPIGTFTGVVYGASASVVVISYTASNVCGDSTATAPLIIDPVPFAGTITGPGMICEGTSATLTNSVSGGAWTSSNTTIAVVGSTGNVSGISGGTATISYSVTNACATAAATSSLYVNPLPAAGTISGASAVCNGFTTPMTASVAGGTWSSVGSAISIGGTTGIVTGLAVGTANIYYTVTNVCGSDMAVMPVTVEALPGAGAIEIPGPICPGHSMLVTDTVVGGAWSGGSAAIATISGAGVVMAVAPGTTIISYSLGNSCGTALATAIVTVSSMPTTTPITGATMVCAGETATMSNATTGGAWTGGTPGVAFVSTAGVVTGLASGSIGVTYSVSNACGTAQATTTVNVSATYTPLVLISAAPGTVIASGQTITLSTTVSGGGPAPDYQWMKNGVPIAGQTLSVYTTNTLADGDSITCRVTGTGSCGKVAYNSVIVHVVSGASNINVATGLSIHPNPTRGLLLINGTTAGNDETVTIAVTNMLGQTVHTAEVPVRNNNINTQVQLREDLANGNYILNIRSTGGNTQTHFVLER